MVLQIFRPPGDGETLSACKLGDINDAISFEYEKFFCGAGTFTLEIPAVSPFAGEIQPNVLLYDRQYGDCFVVRNVKTAADLITVTGYDLTGILRDRLVLLNTAAGETESDGHVLASGTTETVVKQYVTNNMINAEDNTRNYPRLACAADLGRGLEKATGYAAPETVDDVIRPICEGGLLGYGIKLDITAAGSTDAPLFIFDVAERLDRSAEQNERNRVIFSVGRGNVTAMEREVGNTAYRNALWCETDADPVFVFDGEIEPASWGRREEYVSLAVVDSLDEAEVTQAARDTMADKFAQTDSLTIDAGNPLEYGEIYNLGDIVTVYDKAKKVQLDSWISAVKLTRKAGEFTVKITLGEAKPKLLDGYAKQADLLKKNQRDYPAQQEGTARFPVLKEYEVLSDTEIKYNGVTYTFSAGDSGEITGVTTDKGGAFTPTIPGTLTDISAHNAAFMAVAMMSNMGGIKADYIFNNRKRHESDGVVIWDNQGEDSTAMFRTFGTLADDGGVFVNGLTGAVFKYPGETIDKYTWYFCAKAIHIIPDRLIMRNIEDCGCISVFDGNWELSSDSQKYDVINTGHSSLDKTVIAFRKSGAYLDVFVDGAKIGTTTGTASDMPNGMSFILHGVNFPSMIFYGFALAKSAQSDNIIAANSKYMLDL